MNPQVDLQVLHSSFKKKKKLIAKISVTSPIVIKMPTRELLAGTQEFFSEFSTLN